MKAIKLKINNNLLFTNILYIVNTKCSIYFSYLQYNCYILPKGRVCNMINLDNLFKQISDLKLNAKKISEMTGISSGNISDWKSGRSFPSAPKLDILANCLDCSVDYILGRTETKRVVSIPDTIIDIITAEYNKNSDEFISDDFIKEPPKSLIGQKYCFNASDYDKYQHIFDVACKYTQENNIDILEVTGVDKEKYTDMVEYHSDIIEQIFTGKYYTFRDMSAYNKFCEIYKLYVKAYVQNLISDKTE